MIHLYPALLEILKNLPASKIQIQEQSPDKELSFEQAMDYTLDKKKNYINACLDAILNIRAGVNL